MAVFKLIPLLCTHVYSYMFSTVHPPRPLSIKQPQVAWVMTGYHPWFYLRPCPCAPRFGANTM